MVTGAVSIVSSSTEVSTIVKRGSARLWASAPVGVSVRMVRVIPSASIEAGTKYSSARVFSAKARSIAALQAAASTGVPFEKVTPSRIWKTQVFSSGCSQLSAMQPVSSAFSSSRTSVSPAPIRESTQPL